MSASAEPHVLRTTVGDLPLEEYHLRLGGHAWTILHTGAIVSYEDELRFLEADAPKVPYGIVLWPAAIALAHEVASRPLTGERVLELGAGTGLPGIVAASLGAQVVQTDRHKLALSMCRRNAKRNGVTTEIRAADWADWEDRESYDCILGSDILYAETSHGALWRIFDRNLAPGGKVLIADPFRTPSFALLETMEADGWSISVNRWTVGTRGPERPVGVFELSPP